MEHPSYVMRREELQNFIRPALGPTVRALAYIRKTSSRLSTNPELPHHRKIFVFENMTMKNIVTRVIRELPNDTDRS